MTFAYGEVSGKPTRTTFLLAALSALLLVGCGTTPTPTAVAVLPTDTPAPTATATATCTPMSTATTSPASTATPHATLMPAETTAPSVSLLSLISQQSLFSFLEGLTSIQPYSGWRTSATAGEGEALDYVANILSDLTYLRDSRMELERQSFHVFLATELWENRLYLTTAGQESEVPANAPRGHRHDLVKGLRFV